jgi:nitroimidazol reductase NimA-like FMN-containing flavoprotein (pyridoxamine 5'-phosphate oxidase superfamily)
MQKLDQSNIVNTLSDSKIPIRIAFLKPDGLPNIISLWYEEIEGKIYCATQKSAKIVSYLENNSKCGFEIAADKPPYKGTRGSGIAKIIDEKGEEILEILMKKYLSNKESNLSKILKKNAKTEVAIEITPQQIFHYDYSVRMKGA